MPRWIPVMFAALAAPLIANGQQAAPPKEHAGELQKQRPQPPSTGKEEIPPEEDKAMAVEEYSFNPLEAQKWVTVGNYYFKQGKYRAAEGRFRGATKWNEGSSEAWLRLGVVEEKLKDRDAAKEAYVKYLELAPEAKNAAEIRKKVAKLK